MEATLEPSHSFCIFCYKNATVHKSVYQPQPDKLEECQKQIQNRFFKLFLRHLNNNSTKEKLENLQKEVASLMMVCEEDFGLTTGNNILQVCQDCFRIISEFCDLYHQLKCLELRVNWQVDKLWNVMRYADKVPSRVKQFREAVKYKDHNTDELVMFRHTLKRLCQLHKSESFPRVFISPVDIKSANNIKDDEFDDWDEKSTEATGDTNKPLEDYGEHKICSSSPESSITHRKLGTTRTMKRKYNNTVNMSLKKWNCSLCSNLFHTKIELIQHNAVHHVEKYFMSSKSKIVSRVEFRKYASFLVHETVKSCGKSDSTRNGAILYECKFCSKPLCSKQYTRTHVITQHRGMLKEQLEKLQQTMKAEELPSVKFPRKMKHPVPVPKRKLKRSKLFSSATGLEDARNNLCTICKKRFYGINAFTCLQQHIIQCHPESLLISSKLPHLSNEQFKIYIALILHRESSAISQTKYFHVQNGFRKRQYQYQCTYCPTLLCYRRTARDHLVRRHRQILIRKLEQLQHDMSPDDAHDLNQLPRLRRQKFRDCGKLKLVETPPLLLPVNHNCQSLQNGNGSVNRAPKDHNVVNTDPILAAQDLQPPQKCHVCHQLFPEVFYLEQHKAYEHPETYFSGFRCEYVTTEQFNIFVSHLINCEVETFIIKRNDGSKGVKFECAHCSKLVCSKTDARTHVVWVHFEIIGKKLKELQESRRPGTLQNNDENCQPLASTTQLFATSSTIVDVQEYTGNVDLNVGSYNLRHDHSYSKFIDAYNHIKEEDDSESNFFEESEQSTVLVTTFPFDGEKRFEGNERRNVRLEVVPEDNLNAGTTENVVTLSQTAHENHHVEQGKDIVREPGTRSCDTCKPGTKWKCNFCGDVCDNMKSLSIHKSQVHSDHSGNICPICSKVLHIKQSMWRHKISYHIEKFLISSNLKSLPVDQFKKYAVFAINNTLQPVNVHAGGKESGKLSSNFQFKCEYCSLQYCSFISAKMHVVLEHVKQVKDEVKKLQHTFNPEDLPDVPLIQNVQDIRCTVCLECFSNGWKMQRHLLLSHLETFFVSSKSPHLSTEKFKECVTDMLHQQVFTCTTVNATIGNSENGLTKMQLQCSHCSKYITDKKSGHIHLVLTHKEILLKELEDVQKNVTPTEVFEKMQIDKGENRDIKSCETENVANQR